MRKPSWSGPSGWDAIASSASTAIPASTRRAQGSNETIYNLQFTIYKATTIACSLCKLSIVNCLSPLPVLFLVIRLQLLYGGRVGERGHVAERLAFGDVAQQPPHDFSRTRFWQIRGEQNIVRSGDRADLLDDVLLQLVGDVLGRARTVSYPV